MTAVMPKIIKISLAISAYSSSQIHHVLWFTLCNYLKHAATVQALAGLRWGHVGIVLNKYCLSLPNFLMEILISLTNLQSLAIKEHV